MGTNNMFLNRETLAEQSAEIIYDNIINMKPGFEPGCKLNAQELAQQLGISKTPLKIAFKLLESKGVLSIKPRKGTYVVELSKRDIEELIAVRSGIEILAVRLGKGHFPKDCIAEIKLCIRECETALLQDDIDMYREMDAKFHQLIVMAAHNKRLGNLYSYLTACEQIINVYSPRSKDAKEQSTSEHKGLLAVFQRGDAQECLSALEKHWENSSKRILEGYKNYLNSTELPAQDEVIAND